MSRGMEWNGMGVCLWKVLLRMLESSYSVLFGALIRQAFFFKKLDVIKEQKEKRVCDARQAK